LVGDKQQVSHEFISLTKTLEYRNHVQLKHYC
jgi:hypothetical protein